MPGEGGISNTGSSPQIIMTEPQQQQDAPPDGENADNAAADTTAVTGSTGGGGGGMMNMMAAVAKTTTRAAQRNQQLAAAGRWAQSAGQAVQSWTVRKYALPDKNVASQVLMYRQLLHCGCRPGLRLSREYQGTPAQVAVKHMPWWCKDIDETGQMVISYDNLVTRLWIHGAIEPHRETDYLLTDRDMPPVPHEYWVRRLGFQQRDPVTDFRSGGVLSLAMMVHVVESCSDTVHHRFVRPHGDASVLPFGITSINVTNMMSKFLMLSKAVDRMDALLSQKPFWKMFADPNALLVCQELALSMLADVVVELRTERRHEQQQQQEQLQSAEEEAQEAAAEDVGEGKDDEQPQSQQQRQQEQQPEPELVTVFDFAHILEVTERRVQHDLLGAGPKSVQELRSIHEKIRARYRSQLENRLNLSSPSSETPNDDDAASPDATNGNGGGNNNSTPLRAVAGAAVGNVVSKIKVPSVKGFLPLQRTPSAATTTAQQQQQQPRGEGSGGNDDGGAGEVREEKKNDPNTPRYSLSDGNADNGKADDVKPVVAPALVEEDIDDLL